MGSKETRRIPKHACTGRLVIVALSAQPPGVNELCVCEVVGRCLNRARTATFRLLAGAPDDRQYYAPRLWVCSLNHTPRRVSVSAMTRDALVGYYFASTSAKTPSQHTNGKFGCQPIHFLRTTVDI
jgi:hypothetical protein